MGRRRRLLVGGGALVLALAVSACASDDPAPATPTVVGPTPTDVADGDDSAASTSPRPAPTDPTTTDGADAIDDADCAGGVRPEGFSTLSATITSADGEVCEVCLWLADTPDERGRGLMGVTDLGDAAGMAFLFDGPTDGAFYMFQTPTPLSIAWFDTDGAWVGGEEMDPCLDRPSGECPRYSPGTSYVVALEAFRGGLEPLGVGPGARLDLHLDTAADDCALAAPADRSEPTS